MAKPERNPLERLLERIDKNESGCWIIKAYIRPSGYCGFWLKKEMTAHRASWIIHNGKIPDNLCVLHKCDVRTCVNPEHLFLGTKKENTHDCIKKGRFIIKDLNISDELLKQICEEYLKGMTQKELCKKYDIPPRTMFRYIHKVIPLYFNKGEENHASKLTEIQVKEIRKTYVYRKFSTQKLAQKFNVNRSTIENILRGKSWKHVL